MTTFIFSITLATLLNTNWVKQYDDFCEKNNDQRFNVISIEGEQSNSIPFYLKVTGKCVNRSEYIKFDQFDEYEWGTGKLKKKEGE